MGLAGYGPVPEPGYYFEFYAMPDYIVKKGGNKVGAALAEAVKKTPDHFPRLCSVPFWYRG